MDDLEDDAHDDDIADAVSEPSRRLPPILVMFGAVLFMTIGLPLTPGGSSFLNLVVAAAHRGVLEAVMMVLGFGAPFWFGLAVMVGALQRPPITPATLRQILVTNATLLHGQMIVVAWMLWRDGIGAMPAGLLGFAVVSGGFFMVQHASASAAEGSVDDSGRRHDGMSILWLIRWTATVIVALCGWLRLQLLAGIGFGWAIEVGLASAIAIAVVAMRRPSQVGTRP